MRRTARLAPLVALAPLLLGAAPAPAFRLDWPVDCRLGVDCQIQNYIDHDPTPGVRDHTCGARTYDGHDGVDIRLANVAAMRRGVAVLSAADGRVQGVRDGMADTVGAEGLAAVKAAGRECGNGVIVEHADGFVTQYCHLARGSVKVKAGEAVRAGQPLAQVGQSGLSSFPHLHLTVRKDTRPVDPFAYGPAPERCGGGGDASLWRAALPYAPRAVLNAAFTTEPLSLETAEAGPPAPPPGGGPLLIAYVRSIGLQKGDVQALTLTAPDGKAIGGTTAPALTRDQPLRLQFAGARRPAGGWAKGRYTARYTVTAAGRTVLTRRFALDL